MFFVIIVHVCIYVYMYIKITYITLHANMWIDIDPTVCQGDDRFSHVTG